MNIFEVNGYTVKNSVGSIAIFRKQSFSWAYLSVITGLIVFSMGIILGYKILMLAILLVFIPFVYGYFEMPNALEFNLKDETLIINSSGQMSNAVIPFCEIDEIENRQDFIYRDVSPFRDGYQDFINKVGVKLRNGRYIPIIQIQSDQKNDMATKEVIKYISQLIC